MSNYDLDKPGWYLLASQHNKSCYDIFNSYSHPVSLDISCVYIPLLDNSSTNTLIELDNSNSITDISNLQDLSFGTNIGVCVPDYYSTKPYLYGKISDLSNQKFPVKIGIWMNLYEKTVDPVFNIQINQINQSSNPLFLKYNDNLFTSPLDLSFTTDNSFNLTLQRRYDFSLNDISYTIDPTTSNITTFSQNPSHINKNYIDLSGFNDDLLNTDVSGNVGFIKYKIINATTNPDTSFNVTINLFVEDTIFPTIRFTKNYNSSNLSNIYTLDNNASNLNFSGETNATTIRINQTTIRDNLDINFTPIPIAYDQNNTAFTISPVDISYIPSTITYYQGNSSTTEDISYSSGEYMPGTYKIRYEVSDGYEHTTKVDVSFEIVDDINPVLTISNNLQNYGNNFSVYFSNDNLSLNSNYNIISNTDISSGIGVIFDNLNTFNTDISTNSNRSVNFYIKYSEITGNNWLMPDILSGTDFSGIILPNNQLQSFALSELDYLDISNVILEETYRQLANPPQNYLQRRYTATDYADNSSNLTANIRIIDDTIPIVDVSYIHTLFKIDTSIGNTDILGIPQQIFDNSSILHDTSSIIISLYDDIKFDFSMNKPCKCQIDISKNGSIIADTNIGYPIVPIPQDNFSRNQTITLNQNDTDVSGLNQLYFTIYDENNNYLKFKYDLSINDIPQYTLKMYKDTSDKQKLLLRVKDNNAANKYLVSIIINVSPTWSNPFSEQSNLYINNLFNLDFSQDISNGTTLEYTGVYDKVIDNQTQIIGLSPIPSFIKKIQKFNSSTANTGIYYEIMHLPSPSSSLFFPTLTLNTIQNFVISLQETTTQTAAGFFSTEQQPSTGIYENFIDVSNNVEIT